jgi:hypothetical protein
MAVTVIVEAVIMAAAVAVVVTPLAALAVA